MPLNFSLPKLAARRRARGSGGKFEGAIGEGLAGPAPKANPLERWKIALIALLVANVAAFFLLVKPLGGSASDLDAQLANLQMQIKRQQFSLRTARELVTKMEGARGQHDRFMSAYFMDRRTMSSTILSEIKDAAAAAGLVAKEHSFAFEPVEGTENLGMMTITANYEGACADLVKFVNLIDRSKRFLIIDNIQAAPQQQGGKLVSRFKINAFVRETPRGGTVSQGAAPSAGTPVEPLPVAAPPKPAPAAAPVTEPVSAKPSPLGVVQR